MHDNAIHDLALACWSELLSPIKRAAVKTNLAKWESCCSKTKLDRKINDRKMTSTIDYYAINAAVTEHWEIRTPRLTRRRTRNFDL